MAPGLPPGLHRLLYRVAYRVRAWMRRTFRLPIFGVAAVLLDARGHVLLVRHSYGSAAWTLPGGGRSQSEDPAQAIRREVREELRLGIEGLELLATIEETLSGAPHTAHVFIGVAAGEPAPDGREVVAAAFFARDALPQGMTAPTLRRLAFWLERTSENGGAHKRDSCA